jgi:hypothetical protein
MRVNMTKESKARVTEKDIWEKLEVLPLEGLLSGGLFIYESRVWYWKRLRYTKSSEAGVDKPPSVLTMNL